MSVVRRFGAFWYDFLVGDRWELFVGPIAVLAIVAAAIGAGWPADVAGIVLFAGITIVGAISLATSR